MTMSNSGIINQILFDYEELGAARIIELCSLLKPKLLRWLGANHPDNRTRKIFFELTNVRVGAGTCINCNFIVSDDYKSLLVIGERVAISPNVTIICASAPNNSHLVEKTYVKNHLVVSKEIVIEDDVWIGANVTILPGVRIAKACIIGAGSVVAHSTLPNAIYSGVPATFKRTIT